MTAGVPGLGDCSMLQEGGVITTLLQFRLTRIVLSVVLGVVMSAVSLTGGGVVGALAAGAG